MLACLNKELMTVGLETVGIGWRLMRSSEGASVLGRLFNPLLLAAGRNPSGADNDPRRVGVAGS